MEALRLQKEAMQAGTESFLKGAARNVAEKAHEKNKELQYASSNVESVLRQCSTAMATKEELRLSTELVQSTGAAMADRVSQLDRRIDQARARIAEHRTVHGIGLGPDDNTLGLGGGFVEVISEDSSFDEEEESPLMRAAMAGHVQIIRELLAAGADPYLVDEYKRSPLHRASAGGHCNVVCVLLSWEHDRDYATTLKNKLVHLVDNRNCSALHYAAECDHVDLLRLLLLKMDEIGGRKETIDAIMAVDRNGKTCLHKAVKFIYKLVKLLVGKQAQPFLPIIYPLL